MEREGGEQGDRWSVKISLKQWNRQLGTEWNVRSKDSELENKAWLYICSSDAVKAEFVRAYHVSEITEDDHLNHLLLLS